MTEKAADLAKEDKFVNFRRAGMIRAFQSLSFSLSRTINCMKYYVIIRGPLGVGKTTVAKKLAKALHAKYISIDAILEKNGLDKVKGKCIPAGNFIKANETILSQVRGMAVFDGNFYHEKQIQHLVRNLRTPCFVFTLKAPLDVCVKRDETRKGKYGKEAAKAVYALVSRFDYGISIDTAKMTPAEVSRKILSCLPRR
jgi:shikimate kinase